MKTHKQLLIITAINSVAILALALVVFFIHNGEDTPSETPVANTAIENEEVKDEEENKATKEELDAVIDSYEEDSQDQQTVETLADLKAEINRVSWSWEDKVGFLQNVVEHENLEAIACWLPSEEIHPANLYRTLKLLVDDETMDDRLHSFWVEFSELEGLPTWLATLKEVEGDASSVSSIDSIDDYEFFFEEIAKLMIKHRAVPHPDNPDGLCLYDPQYLDYSLEL